MQTKQNKKTYGTLLVAIILIRRRVNESAKKRKVANSVIKRIKVFFFFRQQNGKSNEDKRERENKQKIYQLKEVGAEEEVKEAIGETGIKNAEFMQ